MFCRGVSFLLFLITILYCSVDVSCDCISEKSHKKPKNDSLQAVQDILDFHNKLRREHHVPPLRLDADLSRYAREWAQHLLDTDTFEHREPNSYGENIFQSTGGKFYGADAVKDWYGEIRDYDFKNPGFTMATGHFTQVIWKSTEKIGIGVAIKGDTRFVVCNYDPAGNMQGDFPTNVLPK